MLRLAAAKVLRHARVCPDVRSDRAGGRSIGFSTEADVPLCAQPGHLRAFVAGFEADMGWLERQRSLALNRNRDTQAPEVRVCRPRNVQ